jgi:hypothetical protein
VVLALRGTSGRIVRRMRSVVPLAQLAVRARPLVVTTPEKGVTQTLLVLGGRAGGTGLWFQIQGITWSSLEVGPVRGIDPPPSFGRAQLPRRIVRLGGRAGGTEAADDEQHLAARVGAVVTMAVVPVAARAASKAAVVERAVDPCRIVVARLPFRAWSLRGLGLSATYRINGHQNPFPGGRNNRHAVHNTARYKTPRPATARSRRCFMAAPSRSSRCCRAGAS